MDNLSKKREREREHMSHVKQDSDLFHSSSNLGSKGHNSGEKTDKHISEDTPLMSFINNYN